MECWFILPSSPTGNNRRIELNGIDIRSGIGIDNVFVYSFDVNIDRLKEALSYTLSVWPIVSGRFRFVDNVSFVIEMSDNGIPMTFIRNTQLNQWTCDSNVV